MLSTDSISVDNPRTNAVPLNAFPKVIRAVIAQTCVRQNALAMKSDGKKPVNHKMLEVAKETITIPNTFAGPRNP